MSGFLLRTDLPLAMAGPVRFHAGLAWVTVAACATACVPSGLRWLRVAQREHYLAGSTSRFAARWWREMPWNPPLAVAGLAAGVASLWWPAIGLTTAVVVAVGPVGLALRGRTSPLTWTRRLRTLAAVWVVLEAVVVAIGIVIGPASVLAVVAALAVPVFVDVACLATGPLERRLAAGFVDAAAARLQQVGPVVVAITGSYGKTSTKGHLAHLVAGSRSVVASPASFNNRAGLARAVNEHLAEGTEVFVAEMGTYGPGEIADLCRWCRPDVAIITAIGPVHLERFGSEDRILEAKSEILEAAPSVVLPIDDGRLATVAEGCAAAGKRVTRCSALDASADVAVVPGDARAGDPGPVDVLVHGALLVGQLELASGVQRSNLACAIGAALALGIDPGAIASRLADLHGVEHRLLAARGTSGATVLDDTYNSNPAGAVAALDALAAAAGRNGAAAPEEGAGGNGAGNRAGPRTGRAVVVTPGMVELGPRQDEENRRFAAAVAGLADDLVIVGSTNRRALEEGAASGRGSGLAVWTVGDRDEAVAWVREHVGEGDTVLYENDLPDHYP